MKVAMLTLDEQKQIRELRASIEYHNEAGEKLNNLIRALAVKHFSITIGLCCPDELIDETGKYLILE